MIRRKGEITLRQIDRDIPIKSRLPAGGLGSALNATTRPAAAYATRPAASAGSAGRRAKMPCAGALRRRIRPTPFQARFSGERLTAGEQPAQRSARLLRGVGLIVSSASYFEAIFVNDASEICFMFPHSGLGDFDRFLQRCRL